jgi:hypothetical protein
VIRAYILANPSIRFSFKTQSLDNKDPSLIYAPKTDAPSVSDAVLKLFGRSCLNECA